MTAPFKYFFPIVYLLILPMIGQNFNRVAKEPKDVQRADFVFEVRPKVIAPGEAAILRWSIKGATKVLIEQSRLSDRTLREIGKFGASGSIEIRPKEDTIYVVTCDGPTAYSCASASISVRVKQR